MLPAGTFNMTYQQDMAIIRTRFQWGVFICFLVLLFALPLFASEAWLAIINSIAMILIAVLGLNIVTGYCGQISLGQAAFAASGAYTAAILSSHYGFSAWAALPCSILVAGGLGTLFGLASWRVKGFYLAMTTLGAHFLIIYVLSHGGLLFILGNIFGFTAEDVTGGSSGLTIARPTLGNIVINTEGEFFYLIMVFAIIAVFFSINLARTRVGRAFIAIRDNDLAAEVLGIHLAYYKLLAFFIACAFAGLAGWLQVYYYSYANVEFWPLLDSIWWVGMLIVGGLGSTMGAIYGTSFIILLREGTAILSPTMGSWFPAVSDQIFASLSLIITGLVIALFIVFEPRGINHLWQRFKSYYRLLPFSY